MELPSPVTLFGLSSMTALVVALWDHIKRLGVQALSLLISINHSSRWTAQPILAYMNIKFKRSPFEERYFETQRVFIRPVGKLRRLFYQRLDSQSMIYWKGFWPIWVSSASNKSEDKRGEHFITISFIRGTFDFKAFMIEAEQQEFQSISSCPKGRYQITRFVGKRRMFESDNKDDDYKSGPPEPDDFRPPKAKWDGYIPVQWGWDDIGPLQSSNALDVLSLDDRLLETAREIRFWHKSRDWYKERQIPWKRGYLFHGDPGAGKTSFARAIAEELDLPVYIFDLASMSNNDFVESWKKVMQNLPCQVLLEDIDNVFHERENILKDSSLSFDCILNSLDGIERPDGLFLIVTTNKLEMVDSALGRPLPGSERSSRPGRVDRVVEFKPLDSKGRFKLAIRIVKDEEKAMTLVADGMNDSAAQFQERCFQFALTELFSQQDAKNAVV